MREWKMKRQQRRQWSHRQTGWVTDNTCCKIPSHLPWSVFIDLVFYASQTVAYTSGLFGRTALLSFTLATHYTGPFLSSFPKYLPSFVLCLNYASDHKVKAERICVTYMEFSLLITPESFPSNAGLFFQNVCTLISLWYLLPLLSFCGK